MTEEILSDWLDWMYDEYNGTSLGAGLFLQYRLMLETEAYLDRAAIASHGEGNCAAFPCAGWMFEWNFALTAYGWVAGANTAKYPAAFGSTVEDPQYTNISRTFAETTITGFDLAFKNFATSRDIGKVRVLLNGVVQEEWEMPFFDPSDNTGGWKTWVLDEPRTANKIEVEMKGNKIGTPVDFGFAVGGARVYGDGLNPFV